MSRIFSPARLGFEGTGTELACLVFQLGFSKTLERLEGRGYSSNKDEYLATYPATHLLSVFIKK